MNDTQTREVLARNLRRAVLEKGWSLRRLARECGDPVMSIQNALSGKSLPKAGLLFRAARALGVSVDSLFEVRIKQRHSA